MFGIPTPQSLAAKALCYLVGGLVLVGAGSYAGYRFELGRYERLVAADAIAQTAAVELARNEEKVIAKGNQEDAVAQAFFRGKMAAQTLNLVLGVPSNVTISQDVSAAAADRAGCITYGFVRVLIAGERGEPAESFNLPSGESVDSCTALEPSKLASAVAQDLAAGTANGHQLDSLIAAVRRNDAVVMGSSASLPFGRSNNALENFADLVGTPGVKSDMPEPNGIDNGDGQPGPVGIGQMKGGIEPEIVDAPASEVRGWEPVNASDRATLAYSGNIFETQNSTATLPQSLRDIGVNLHCPSPQFNCIRIKMAIAGTQTAPKATMHNQSSLVGLYLTFHL